MTAGLLGLDTTATSVTLTLPASGAEVLVLTMLTAGYGSSRLQADRGMPGEVRRWGFVRRGELVDVVQRNTHFGSRSGNADGTESFADVVLASVPVVDARDGGIRVDLTSVVCRDLVGVTRWAAIAGRLGTRCDLERSGVIPTHSRWSADGVVEIEVQLTFTGIAADDDELAPAPGEATVRQRVTLLPLPQGFEPQRFSPELGGYGKMRHDTDEPLTSSPRYGLQPRFRLDAEGHADSDGRVAARRPIVFTVDPDIPEPYLSAIIEGGNWWQAAFSAAGWRDAFVVRVRESDEDPAAAGVNNVWWVHRDGRGWSMGAALCDPATGEIVKGNVRLGSQRVTQLTALGEALLSPYGRPDERQRIQAIQDMTLARLRHLAAHEIGHALGFMHNYRSTEHPAPSVMDYPHPELRVGRDGIELGVHSYSDGVGPWDTVVVASAYDRRPERRHDALLEARRLGYLTDHDGHAPESGAAGTVPWVNGAEPLKALNEIMAVREAALAGFGPGCLPPHRSAGEREERFAMLHLLHRHHAQAVIRQIGGVRYSYANADAVGLGSEPVSGSDQRAALDAATALLRPAIVAPHAGAFGILTPPAIRNARASGDFESSAGAPLDPFAPALAAARIVTAALMHPARLTRIAAQSAADSNVPTIHDLVVSAVEAAQTGGASEYVSVVLESLAEDALDALKTPSLPAPAFASLLTALRSLLVGHVPALRRRLKVVVADRSAPSSRVPLGIPL